MIDLRKVKSFAKIQKKIDCHKVVSFDLFDTLIKRDCYQPSEIFYFIEKDINIKYHIKSNFAYFRKQAEKRCRQESQNKEITQEEIYDKIDSKFLKENLTAVMELEQKYEYNCCQWNPLMKPIYNYCIKKKKKIFITTDMYLPQNIIIKILNKLGVHYDGIFVSSEIKLTKRNGELFQYIKNSLHIKANDILHIGDNFKSDFIMPKLKGIDAILIKKKSLSNLLVNQKNIKRSKPYANLCSFINNHSAEHSWNALRPISTVDYFCQAGYEAEGPVLFGFINWLQEQFIVDKIQKVFFLSRDGQLMQRAYNKLNNTINNEYMYASRRALIIPSLWIAPELKDIKTNIHWPRLGGTISAFLEKLGLNPDRFKTVYSAKGFDIDKRYLYNSLWENVQFIEIYNNFVKKEVISNSKEQYNIFLKYIKQLDFSGNVAIVDIGWNGSMQAALQRILEYAQIPIQINGYYLGLRPDSPLLENIQAKGYLFDNYLQPKWSAIESSFNSIVEILFSANHGTVLRYKEIIVNNKSQVIPLLELWEYEEQSLRKDYIFIKSAQRGALEFINDAMKQVQENFIPKKSTYTFLNWIELGINPSKKSSVLFGNLHMIDDGGIYSLARPKKRRNYLLNYKAFIQDILNSYWRIGFIKRLIGFSKPFSNIYIAMLGAIKKI